MGLLTANDLDFRLRGNDRWFVREVDPNDAIARRRLPLSALLSGHII
jgi:hypothetical protein